MVEIYYKIYKKHFFPFFISIILTRINLTVENDFDGTAPPDAGNSTVNLI